MGPWQAQPGPGSRRGPGHSGWPSPPRPRPRRTRSGRAQPVPSRTVLRTAKRTGPGHGAIPSEAVGPTEGPRPPAQGQFSSSRGPFAERTQYVGTPGLATRYATPAAQDRPSAAAHPEPPGARVAALQNEPNGPSAAFGSRLRNEPNARPVLFDNRIQHPFGGGLRDVRGVLACLAAACPGSGAGCLSWPRHGGASRAATTLSCRAVTMAAR
jgi:hypothetical protein